MAELLAKDIMTKRVMTVDKNTTLDKLIRILIRNDLGCIPVVDEENDLVGMVSEADIITKKSSLPLPMSFSFAFLDKYESYTKSTKDFLDTKVKKIMSRDLKTVGEDMTVDKVVNIMLNNNINRVPVVGPDKKLSGIITRSDIMKIMVKESRTS